jgi:hypothetical protein
MDLTDALRTNVSAGPRPPLAGRCSPLQPAAARWQQPARPLGQSCTPIQLTRRCWAAAGAAGWPAPSPDPPPAPSGHPRARVPARRGDHARAGQVPGGGGAPRRRAGGRPGAGAGPSRGWAQGRGGRRQSQRSRSAAGRGAQGALPCSSLCGLLALRLGCRAQKCPAAALAGSLAVTAAVPAPHCAGPPRGAVCGARGQGRRRAGWPRDSQQGRPAAGGAAGDPAQVRPAPEHPPSATFRSQLCGGLWGAMVLLPADATPSPLWQGDHPGPAAPGGRAAAAASPAAAAPPGGQHGPGGGGAGGGRQGREGRGRGEAGRHAGREGPGGAWRGTRCAAFDRAGRRPP